MMGRWRYWRLKTKLLFLTLFTSALGITLVCASLIFVAVSYTHLTLPTNREV